MEVIKMTKKLLVFFLALAVVVAFSLPVLAKEVVTGKIQALDKVAKKITINGRQYSLSDEAAQAQFKIGDRVEATIEGKVVKKLARELQ
jgi:small-conductance mechanosensitive channel